MKPVNRAHDPAAEEQASLWAARLEGATLEASDRADLDAWLAEKPTHRALLSEYCQFSADLEQQLPILVAKGEVKMPVPAPTRRRWNLGWLSLAGCGLAAAAVAVALFVNQPTASSQAETLATSVAQRQSFTLSDGTKVELNALTSLRVENTGDERHVRLASGEAFFMVAKDKSRPFIVDTPTGSVRVTGTVFNVRTDKGELDVAVVEGSVQVRPSEAVAGDAQPPSPLTANQRLTANGKVLVQTVSAEALDDLLAWRRGQMAFVDVPLREAIERVARYHGRGVRVSDAAAVKTVGGLYTIDKFDDFLNDLEGPFDLKLTHNSNGTVSVSLRTEK